jgi:hypothetical protein
MTNLRFRKVNGSHADVLAAAGAADLLHDLNPIFVDHGNEIELKIKREVNSADLANTGPGFKYLKAGASEGGEDEDNPKKKATKKVPDAVPPSMVFDYNSENEKYKRQMAAKASKDPDILESAQLDKPDPDFRTYRIVKALQAESGLNKFVEQFCSLTPEKRESAILKSLNGSSDFFFESPLVQLFNPQAAKGYALLKPTGTDRNDKTKEKWAEPFFEWLRYRGFFAGSAGWFLGNKGEHVRVYTPIPKHMPFSLYSDVTAHFRSESLAGSAPKMDCLGALRLTRILIERSTAFAPPSQLISGIWVTHYQSLGQVRAVTATDQVAIPRWLDLKSKPDAVLWLEILEEHDKILRRLDDDISEELGLLKQYRCFLQGREREATIELAEFLAAYGNHIFRLRGQGKWLLPQFTREKVEAILQASYKEILENPGFRAIADAIRSATVSAQVSKKRGSDYREIQYGALPELRRKIAEGRDDFMQAVSEFVSSFNTESARRYEQGKSGYRISQDDFAAFAHLLDENPSWETIGTLLCAMATCKLGKDKEEAPE